MLSTSKLTQLVLRPNVGKEGKQINVRSNFYRVKTIPTCNIYHYDVDFEPAIPEKKCHAIWDVFQKTVGQEHCADAKPIFDGRKNVFSVKSLNFGKEEAKQFSLDLTADPAFGRNPKNIFKIRIKLVNVINMSELQLFLDGKSDCTPNCLTAIMVLDILVRYLPSRNHYTFGRSIFTTDGRRPLPNGAELWQGYYQSVRPAAGRLFVNVDVSATAVYESGPVPDIVVKIINKHHIDELRNGIQPRDIQLITRLLKARTIQVNHRGERNGFFKITGIGLAADKLKFTNEEGVEQTVASYFVERYNKRLRYPFLPCIQVKKDIFLPMEVCELAAGQRYTKKLNGKQTSEFIKITCQPPNVRVNKIMDGLKLLEHQQNPFFEEFGMEIGQEMEIVKARVLKSPSIKYSDSQPPFVPQGGSWSLRGKRLAVPATLNSWSVVNFAGPLNLPSMKNFIREMCAAMLGFGLRITNREPPVLSADPLGDLERVLKEAFLKAGNAARAIPQMIVCIVPSANSPLYGEIKRITDTLIGIPSQCIKVNNVSNPNNQYLANVTLKINIKLGGTNYRLMPSEIPFISKTPTIIFGADVNHPAPGAENSPSIAALTASMDSQATMFDACLRYQSGRTEMIQDLGGMTKEMLKRFYKRNRQKPRNIIFYRDGVSEGQFQAVLDCEVAAVKAACASLEKGYAPNITFVVVQKRHHARFFPIKKDEADKNGNCLPGTVIDTTIVHPFEFDFFLQSHFAIKGTARSSRYVVLYDDNKFSADALQELSYRLCYVYGRSSCAVSIVPAAYYADIVAARGRLHCRGGDWSGISTNNDDAEAQRESFAPVHSNLQNTMYYM
ncbi:hypothetical protein [Parasitella parasitica]|uniref:Piwi domain-containing protein n=1 Tax=Parasitella parasitica TaxID=35722 RepID=A0A0B7NNX1_9FUNG|nr:hypothetical protein [Parasitella parasitica]